MSKIVKYHVSMGAGADEGEKGARKSRAIAHYVLSVCEKYKHTSTKNDQADFADK